MSTYVFDGTEVKLTGRTAIRKRTVRRQEKIDELVEITPVQTDGLEWKKWVAKEELFEVVDENKQ